MKMTVKSVSSDVCLDNSPQVATALEMLNSLPSDAGFFLFTLRDMGDRAHCRSVGTNLSPLDMVDEILMRCKEVPALGALLTSSIVSFLLERSGEQLLDEIVALCKKERDNAAKLDKLMSQQAGGMQ